MSHLDDGQVIKRSGTGLNAIFQRKFVQKKPEKPKEAEKPRIEPKEAEKPREKPKKRKEYKTSDGKKKEEPKKEEPKKDKYFCYSIAEVDDYHSIIELERPTSTLTIYQIPPHVRVCAPFAYTPTLVSIGPFHRYRYELRSMEGYKTRFLMRYYKNPPFEVLDRLVEQTLAPFMEGLELEARNRYSRSYREVDSKNFVRMMIHDGYFVVELFRLYEKSHKEQVNDHIFESPWILPVIRRDLLLLENQLPFFVLEKVFELTRSENEPSLVYLALNFFKPLLLSEESFIKTLYVDRKHDHLLGLFRLSFLPCEETERLPSTFHRTVVKGRPLIRSVTELKNKGIKFARRENHNLLDIEFNHGVLEVPPLLIHRDTDPIFRNFIAYEFCHPYAQPYFTRYVKFLGNLLKSNHDFEILHQLEIIDSTLGNIEDVAKVFNNLSKQIDYKIENEYLVEQLTNLNKAYENKWHGWKVQWVQDYCRTPWKFFSFLTAIILLILAFTQTFFAVLSYFRPPPS